MVVTPTAPMVAIPTAPTADPSHHEWLTRRELHPDAPRLADLVDDVARFRARDVYRCPRLSAAGDRDVTRFADVDMLWADLLRRSTRRPAFRLVREGATTAPAAVTRPARIGDRDLDDLAAPNRVIDGYRDGCTVVLQGLHLTDPHLARFATNLALDLDQPVQLNAYLSPSSARGLDVHFDYHDVFVIQLAGTKRWRVWEPIARSRDPIGGKHVVRRPRLEEVGEPLLDLTLQPGAVLYLPRGHPHVAETTDGASAHLTVGLLAITWHRAVRRIIDHEISAGRLRQSIPLSTLDDASDVAIDERPEEWWTTPDLSRLHVDLRSIELRRWVANEVWSRQAATRLRPLEPVDPAVADRPLAFAPGPLITLSRSGSQSLLFVGDRTISLPDDAHRFLAALLRHEAPICRTHLSGLDDESSRSVVARLLDEGVLVEHRPVAG